MPRRYRAALAWWDDLPGEERQLTSMDIIETDRSPRWSGLYDSSGNKLMVHEETNPVGFVHLKVR